MTPERAVELVQRAVGERFRLEPVPPDFPEARPPWRLFPARELSSGRSVVVKAIPIEDLDPLIGTRFEKEVGSAEDAPGWLGQPQLDHPRLLPVLSRSGRDGILYYVTPWLPEGALRARLQREPRLVQTEAVAILGDLAGALGFLHERGFVHGRVKPENVLFDSGRAVLADGFSRVVGLVVQMPDALGNIDYDAPELARGGRADARSDVYSLASVGFEMLAGQRPFVGTGIQVAYAKLSGAAPPLTSLCPQADPGISQILAKALEREPGDRYADATELSAALRGA